MHDITKETCELKLKEFYQKKILSSAVLNVIQRFEASREHKGKH